MSSINPYVTFTYSQPDEYHLSHDSVFLARRVFEYLQQHEPGLTNLTSLDLCAGGGVVGLDLLFHLQSLKADFVNISHFDFLEIQGVYLSHFKRNVDALKEKFPAMSTQTQFIQANYAELIRQDYSENKYDLIVCNPPYFRPGQGLLSLSDFKNRCRFFIDSDFKSLIQAIAQSLKPKGKAFVLIKSLDKHGINIDHEIESFQTDLTFQKLAPVRSTDLYFFQKAEVKL